MKRIQTITDEIYIYLVETLIPSIGCVIATILIWLLLHRAHKSINLGIQKYNGNLSHGIALWQRTYDSYVNYPRVWNIIVRLLFLFSFVIFGIGAGWRDQAMIYMPMVVICTIVGIVFALIVSMPKIPLNSSRYPENS